MSTNPSFISVLTAWTVDPSVILGLLLAAVIYACGIQELAHRNRQGRQVTRRHAASFALGLLSIALALESPIDSLSVQLLSAHMVQHLLLLMVAPPLLLLGKPVSVLAVGAPRPVVHWLARSHARTPWFKRLTRMLTSPFFSWPVFIGVLLAWHLPVLYDAALQNAGVHLSEHLCFLVTGLLFWWVIIQPYPGRTRLAAGWRLLYTFAAMVPGSFLGLVFILSPGPIYPFYAGLPRLWGAGVLDDQGLAGSIMLICGDALLACAVIPLFDAMLTALDQRERARDARIQQGE